MVSQQPHPSSLLAQPRVGRAGHPPLLPSPRCDVSPCPSCPRLLYPQHLTVASSCEELQVRLLTDPCLPPARCASALPPIHLTLIYRIGIGPLVYRLTILSNPHQSSLTTLDPPTPLTAHSPVQNVSHTNHAPALESSNPHPLSRKLHQYLAMGHHTRECKAEPTESIPPSKLLYLD
jgi:hypothetical protein